MTIRMNYYDAQMRKTLSIISRENAWRIAGYTEEDLLQDGFVVYCRCYERYVGKEPGLRPNGTPRRFIPEEPDKTARKHFMRLVHRAFMNHIYSLAKKQPSLRERPVSDFTEFPVVLYDAHLPEDSEVATASLLLKTAPREVRMLIDLLVNDALDLGKYLRHGKTRETNNERYCRLLGLPVAFDVAFAFERHFLPEKF